MASQIRVGVMDGKARYAGRTLAKWVPNMVDDIVRALDPLEVILLGSLARGDDTRDSDVDLLIELAHARTVGPQPEES